MEYGRNDLLQGLARSAEIIEIGPSYNPMAAKRAGWRTTVIDHGSRSELLAKYADDSSVDGNLIEDVDFVWRGGSLADLIPVERHGSYDAFIAAHVIEHTTDIVRFFQSAEVLLKPTGVVLLVVPDKRKCFDFYRPISTTGEAIQAFIERRQRHTIRNHVDHGLYASFKEGNPAWFESNMKPAIPVESIRRASHFISLHEQDQYVDCHAWQFTPSSFQLITLELHSLGLITLSTREIHEAPHTEFYAILHKGSPVDDIVQVDELRRNLMERAIIEQAEQSRQIDRSPFSDLTALRDALRRTLSDIP